jgi:hypothetical protein
MPTKDLLGPYQFERGQPSRQSMLLDARLIVRNHIGDVAFHRHHGKAVPARKPGKFRTTNTASHLSPNIRCVRTSSSTVALPPTIPGPRG